jgi:hypothetical protein
MIDKSGNMISNGSHELTSSNGGFLTQYGCVKSPYPDDLYAAGSVAIGNLVIPDSLGWAIMIKENGFSHCDSVKTAIFNNVGRIGWGAFNNCSELNTINLTGVAIFSDYAFADCSSLVSIIYNRSTPASANGDFVIVRANGDIQNDGPCTLTMSAGGFLTTLGFANGFEGSYISALGCVAIGAITIPPLANGITPNGFADCDAITSLSLGVANLSSIDGSAFAGCARLERVDLKSVSDISGNAFNNCIAINQITYNRLTPASANDDYVMVDKDGTVITDGLFTITGHDGGFLTDYGCVENTPSYELFSIDGLSLGDVVVPNSVRTIEDECFAKSTIKSINLSNVTSIGNQAFENCNNLNSIDLSNVETIGDNAFKNCSLLNSMELGNMTTDIGDSAFVGCSLSTAIVGGVIAPADISN